MQPAQLKYTTFSPIAGITTKAYSSEYLRNDRSYFLSAERFSGNYQEAVKPDPANVIVLHPGSRWLRLGFVSDAFPHSVPQVIARRLQRPDLAEKHPSNYEGSAEWREKYEAAVSASETDLKTRLIMTKHRAVPHARQFCLTFNSAATQANPEIIQDHNDPYRIEWISMDSQPAYLVGRDALRIPGVLGNYVVRYPMRKRTLNSRDYDSLKEVLGDLEVIWAESVKKELGVEARDFPKHYVILVIPDVFQRATITSMVDLLFEMNFRAVMVVQESPSVTFGAGASSACVIDVGAQATSISCVEDGMIVPGSRLMLPYGGDQVSRYFAELLCYRGQLPYKKFSLFKPWDREVLEELKERFCSLNEADVAVQVTNFFVRSPQEHTRKFSVKIYDETFLAPAAFFVEAALTHLNQVEALDSNRIGNCTTDFFDYCAEDGTDDVSGVIPITSVMQIPRKPMAIPATATTTINEPGEDIITENDSPFPSLLQEPLSNAVMSPPPNAETLPLDKAILYVINTLPSEQHMRRAISHIILAGGASCTLGLDHQITERIKADLLVKEKGWDRLLKIWVGAREMDPRFLAWKGASVAGRLDSAQDAWVLKEEWRSIGVRILRDKITFLW